MIDIDEKRAMETGQIYGVELLGTLPLDGGMRQALHRQAKDHVCQCMENPLVRQNLELLAMLERVAPAAMAASTQLPPDLPKPASM